MSQYNRFRAKSDESLKRSYLYFGADGVLYHVDWPVGTFTDVEFINDEKGGHLSRGDTIRIKNVEHAYFRYSGSHVVPYLGDYGNVINYQDQTPWMESNVLDGMLANVSDSLMSQCSEEAFNSFSEQFPEKLSFSEFVFGLGKLKDLLPKISGDVAKDLSGAWLTKKFGWDNLLSDLKVLSSLLSDVQARLLWLRKTYGKPTKLGFYKRDIVPTEVGASHTWSLDRGLAIKVTLISAQCDFRAGATLVQRLKHLDDMIGLIRGFTGALGLANPLKAVWVNLPFSFVIDWFFRVSAHLDHVGRLHPAEQWDLANLSCSVRQKATFSVIQMNHDIAGVPAQPDVLLGHVHCERYVRRSGLPLTWGVYSPTALNPSQLTLLLALLGQQSA